MQMKDGAALKLTTAKYYIPSGRCIQKPELSKNLSHQPEENLPSDSVEQESNMNKEKFFTRGGRVVYGGGGIVPDVSVPSEKLSPLEYNLLAKLAFFDFAVHYTATHPQLPKDFDVDQTMLKEFKQSLEAKNFTYQTASEVELEKLKETIKEEGSLESTYGEGRRAIPQVLTDLQELLKAQKEDDLKESEDYIKWEIKENILVKLSKKQFRFSPTQMNIRACFQ
jgi:carboxyl-terminal processing protease